MTNSPSLEYSGYHYQAHDSAVYLIISTVICDLLSILNSIICPWPCVCMKVETPGALDHTSTPKSKGTEVDQVIVSAAAALIHTQLICYQVWVGVRARLAGFSPRLCLCHVRSHTAEEASKLLAQILFPPISNSHTHTHGSSHIHIWYFPRWMASTTFVLLPGTFVT